VKKKLNISIVSYTNTLPFRIGIETSPVFQKNAHITYDNPATCAKKVLNDEADIGLIPVGVLSQMDDYHIIGNYCIGAKGRVDTVKLYGEVPVEEMTSIVLDYQSGTSVKLIKYLTENYWHIAPEFLNGSHGFELRDIEGTRGGVVIGDRTFELDKQFPYKYDLSEVWWQHTGLPFVFAVWVSKTPLSRDLENLFNHALEQGIDRINQIANEYQHLVPAGIDLDTYLTNRIDYKLDSDKRKAMDIFLDYLKSVPV